MGAHRVTQEMVEALVTGTGAHRATQLIVEALTTGNGAHRVTQEVVEVLFAADSKHRVTQEVVEVLCNVPSGSVIDVEASNTLSLSQSTTPGAVFNRALSHTLTMTDGAARTIDADATSDLLLDHEATVIKYKNLVASNALVLTQDVARSMTYGRGVNQAVVMVSSPNRNVYTTRSIPQSLVMTQIAVGINTKKVLSELALSQTAEATVGKNVRQIVEMTQLATANVYYLRNLFSNFIPFQILTRSLTARRSLDSILSLVSSASGMVVKPTYSELALSQSAVGVSSKPASNTLVLAQSATFTRIINLSVGSGLNLASGFAANRSIGVEAETPLAVDHTARGTKVLTASASSGLSLIQELVRERFFEASSSLLGLTGDALAQKIATRNVASVLTLGQTVGLSKTINRSVGSTLVFTDSHIRNAGFIQTVVPNVQGIIAKNLVFLSAGNRSITLPPPEFSDAEAGTGKVNIKRTMTGARFVYARKSPTDRLSYTFIIGKDKLNELRRFILDNNSATINMENWKGERWVVKLTNNPFSLTEDAFWSHSNKSSITLDFEGVKIS